MTLNGLENIFIIVQISEKNYNEESDEGYPISWFQYLDAQYSKSLIDLDNDLLILHERINI